jgi:hypothetical protein
MHTTGSHKLSIRRIDEPFAVVQLEPGAIVPEWATAGVLFAVVRTAEELSLVCSQHLVPEGVKCERDWVALKLEGPFAFSTVGVLSSVIAPLAAGRVPVFVLSTFDTDYVLIKQENLSRAIELLRAEGHTIDP